LREADLRVTRGPDRGLSASQARIDRLALEREHAEDAVVDAAQRLAAHEALKCLDAECERAKWRETACGPGRTGSDRLAG
jgi:uncharacterized low-complexity protein